MNRGQRRASDAAGFTLVEVMVVIVIIGIMVTFATLSLSDHAVSDKLDIEAQRLDQLFKLAQEEAELKGYQLGFRFTDTRYQFLVVGPEGRWIPVPDGPLRERLIPPPLQMSLRVEDRPVPPAQDVIADADGGSDDATELTPQVLILSSGELTAFALDLTAPGVDATYRISGSLIGTISRERRDALDGPV